MKTKPEIIGMEGKFLKHGMVRVVDIMGGDSSIADAARVSYGAGTRSVNDNRGLIRYLMRNRHTSPIEMCEIKFHLKMPIYVARQHIRHRTANVNEYSGRYSVMKSEFETLDSSTVNSQSTTNKQGSGLTMDPIIAENLADMANESCDLAFETYDRMIGVDVARETARTHLPLSTYTEMYWKIDLHNLFHYLTLRTDPHAQREIREMAELMETAVHLWVPDAYQAWVDYVKDAVTFSRMESIALLRISKGEEPDFKSLGMKAREIREFKDKAGQVTCQLEFLK